MFLEQITYPAFNAEQYLPLVFQIKNGFNDN